MNLDRLPNEIGTCRGIETRYGQYWDSQSVAQSSILPYFGPSELPFAEFILTDRLARCAAGRIAARDHKHVEIKLHSLDPALRLRWDFDQNMYAIDRFSVEYGYHFTICFWSHTLGEGGALHAILDDGDMQKVDYLTKKRRYQEYQLLANNKKREEAALAAVDYLGRKGMQQFIDVEQALQTGEKIVVSGQDAEILNRMHENTKMMDRMAADGLRDRVILPGEAQSTNPHMNWRRRNRKLWNRKK